MKEVKTILTFHGAIVKGQENLAPADNGIYAAFACTMKTDLGTVKWHPERTIYIGKAEGKDDTIKKRISDHVNDRDESDSGKQSYWEKNYLKKGETVVYTYAKHEKDLHDIEAVLINVNHPRANIVGQDNFVADADAIEVTCLGNKGTLKKNNVKQKEDKE